MPAALINLVRDQPGEVTPDQLPKVPLPGLVTFQRWLFIKTHQTASDYEGSENRGIRSDYDYGRVHEERSEANIYLRSAIKIRTQRPRALRRYGKMISIIGLLHNIPAILHFSTECQTGKEAEEEAKIYLLFVSLRSMVHYY